MIHFFAPLNEDKVSEEINYGAYKEMDSDQDLLARGDGGGGGGSGDRDQAYVYKQCMKYCYYIQKVHGKEKLQMKAEFFKDLNGKIWFYYAKSIYCRDCPNDKALKSNQTCRE